MDARQGADAQRFEALRKEEYAIVLDFLPNGYSYDTRPMHMKTSIAQVIGKTKFVILELVPKKDVFLQPLAEVYIGEGKRDQIHHVAGKLSFEKLTSTARSELNFALAALVKKNQDKFIKFFNTAQPLSTRMHQLELLAGLGKKHMWEIIEQREIAPFKNFDDLKKRVKLMPDPEKLVIKRIMSELEGNEKYILFVDKL